MFILPALHECGRSGIGVRQDGHVRKGPHPIEGYAGQWEPDHYDEPQHCACEPALRI